MKPRITLITLGVDDLERALAFYRDGLGLATDGIVGDEFEHGAVAFFDLESGLKLALWPRGSIAADSRLPLQPASATELAIAHNVESQDEVDAVMEQAGRAGARIAKPAQPTFYGGYAGYFQDPDGHLWEVAFNPGFVSASRGLPRPRTPDPLLFPVPSALDTRRLLLRPFRVDDATALHAALTESIDDLRSNLWFLPWVAEEPTLRSAEIRCRKAAASFLLRTDLPYLAFDKLSGRLVASVGLHRTDWTLPKTEVGYWVRSTETGKGYAREGVAALTDWALRGLGAKRVELVVDARNAASRAVAERCGFHLEGVLHHVMRSPDGRLCDSCIYARLPVTT